MPANALRITHAVTVHLDGLDVSAHVLGWSMSRALEALHDELELTVDARKALGWEPADNAGMARIKLTVDGTPYHFILEERELGETSVRVWGRSASAGLDAPHAGPVSIAGLSAPRTAQEQAVLWSGGLDLDWQLDDWQLPSDFSHSGTPAEGLAALAQAAGGVCRAKHLSTGGGFVLRPKWPVAPADQHRQVSPAVVAIHDRDVLLSCGASLERAEGVTRVVIEGHASAIEAPALEIETEDGESATTLPGQDVIVRAAWPCAPELLNWEPYVTSGAVQELGSYAETITETVAVEDGVASPSQPVHALESIAIVGTPPAGQYAAPVWTVGGTSLEIGPAGSYGVVTLTYQTRGHRWRWFGHDVASGLFVLWVQGVDDVAAEVELALPSLDGISSDETISEPWQTSTALAVQRAVQWLWEQAYDRLLISWSAPHTAPIADGQLVQVHSMESGLSQVCVVTSVRLSGDGLQISQELEGIAWVR